jgi:hypothetical protein
MCERYANLWLANLERVESQMHMDYFTVFFKNLSPSFLGKPEHVKILKEMLTKHEKSDKTYLC